MAKSAPAVLAVLVVMQSSLPAMAVGRGQGRRLWRKMRPTAMLGIAGALRRTAQGLSRPIRIGSAVSARRITTQQSRSKGAAMLKSSPPFRFLSTPSRVLLATLGVFAWVAMASATTAIASSTVGSQDRFDGVGANSPTRFASCSKDQFKKCVDYCAKRNLANYGTAGMAACRQYCRENASSQNGCQ